MNDERILIVNADELGRTPGINRGILEAHDRGIVTSASAMVRRAAIVDAAHLVAERPLLSVGLHVDLCEWEVRDGRWVPVEIVVPVDDGDAVAEEVLTQLATFRELFGRDPSHLDSHQDVHRSDPARSVLLTLARELDVPLRHFQSGIFVCSEFHGQTSRGEPFPEGVSPERLLSLIAALPPGCSELVCRPGRGSEKVGMYGAEREAEVAALCDPAVRQALERERVRLRSFHDARVPRGAEPEGVESSFRERGRAAYERRDYRRAEMWFRRAVRVGGDRPWPWLWLARAQLRNGDAKASEDSVARALEVLPGWPPALLHLADLHLAADREDEAVPILLELTAVNGDGPDLAAGVARRAHRLGDPQLALQVTEALAVRAPDDEGVLAARAVALFRSGDRKGAARTLGPAIRTGRGRSGMAAAEFHLEIGRSADAWDLIRGADPARKDRALVTRIAQALRKSGDLVRSWEAFDRAIALGADDASTLHWRDVVLGEVHVLSGAHTPSVPPLRHYDPVPGRVLHLVGKSLPHVQTGYSVRTRYVTLAQREAGLDPHVVTQLGFPWDQGVREAALSEDLDGVPYHRILGQGPVPARLDDRLRANLEGLVGLVRRLRPAALHAASDYRNALLALALGRACRIPVVYEVRGFWEETWRSKQDAPTASRAVAYRWRRDRELDCMREADRVVTLADVMREELVRRGIPAASIAVVPNAVDPHAFMPGERDRALAQELGIGPDEVVLGYISSMISYEGIGTLVRAIAELVRRGHPVRGLLVGDGEERAALEAAARDLGVADRVLFPGRVPHDEIRRYYGLIDVFVVPRTGDRVCRMVTPLKPYEAMAMERALVVSGVEALREMIDPGATGLHFRPEDVEDLVRVLEPLIRSPARRLELGRAARKWVCANRTWTQNGERYGDLFRELHVLESPPVARPAILNGRPNGRPKSGVNTRIEGVRR